MLHIESLTALQLPSLYTSKSLLLFIKAINIILILLYYLNSNCQVFFIRTIYLQISYYKGINKNPEE